MEYIALAATAFAGVATGLVQSETLLRRLRRWLRLRRERRVLHQLRRTLNG